MPLYYLHLPITCWIWQSTTRFMYSTHSYESELVQLGTYEPNWRVMNLVQITELVSYELLKPPGGSTGVNPRICKKFQNGECTCLGGTTLAATWIDGLFLCSSCDLFGLLTGKSGNCLKLRFVNIPRSSTVSRFEAVYFLVVIYLVLSIMLLVHSGSS